ncbi:hypothetical protein CDD83_10973 [Cordyceps sp. RAO-2017]|nr:hypothetical protein CDD83_10973 [Cordyceps sp. RAO-2017]
MDDVVSLVILPFRHIVEKGRTAVENATGSPSMLGTAVNLVKEGEQALKVLEPICRKRFDEYGSNFVDALKENDEIGQYQEELDELLWSFDEYVDDEGFDPAKFAELQALSRRAAMKINRIILRMKIEARPRDMAHIILSQMSPPSSPLFPQSPLQPVPPAAAQPVPSRPASAPRPESPTDVRTVTGATRQLKEMMNRRFSGDDDAAGPRQTAPAPNPEPASSRQMPHAPPTKPWESPLASSFDDALSIDLSSIDEALMDLRPESPVDPRYRPPSSGRQGQVSPIARKPMAGAGRGLDLAGSQWRASCGGPACSTAPPPGHAPPRTDVRFTMPIPEEARDGEAAPVSRLRQFHYPPPTKCPSRPIPSIPASPSGGPPATPRDGGPRRREPVRIDKLADVEPRSPRSPTAMAAAILRSRSPPGSAPRSPAGLEVPEPLTPTITIDNGLIPVEVGEEVVEAEAALPRKATLSRGPPISASSSFYQQRGFCEGAKAVTRGENGVKKVQKPVRRTLTRVVARCSGCVYELDYREIESDVSKQDDGNLSKCGVNYRVRFLQKSHMPADKVDDVPYGCVFCVAQGSTLDESDATVFFTTKALFSHLARHPRPLPQVPGVCVVEEMDVPRHLRNNYDIHFPNPPAAHAAHENRADTAGRPTGVALKHARRARGQRQPHDGAAALELAQGGSVTGIRWPSKYKGEWMVAWHDGVLAAVPTDVIRLDPPAAADIRICGASNVRAKARWKFAPKDRGQGNWLKFDKNESITNIGWSHPEHWCWSGTNAKGKRGIFPRAFIEADTVQGPSEAAAADLLDQLGGLPGEKSKSSSASVFSKLSVRRSPGRPPSSAASTSSRETSATGFRVLSRVGREASEG